MLTYIVRNDTHNQNMLFKKLSVCSHHSTGLLDNVLSDYLWAKAVILTTTTVATAGLTIQVPLAAVVDSVMGNAPNVMDYVGAAAVLVGFMGINIPSVTFSRPTEPSLDLGHENLASADQDHILTR